MDTSKIMLILSYCCCGAFFNFFIVAVATVFAVTTVVIDILHIVYIGKPSALFTL